MTNQQNLQVRAKQSFYHDLTGSRACGEVFQVSDQTTLQALEQMGYVETLEANQANAEMMKQQQEAQQRAQQMGQEQAKANEQVSMARHEQNMQANQHTEQINQATQQRAQQNGADFQNEADKKALEEQQKQFNPSAVSPKATAKKANQNESK